MITVWFDNVQGTGESVEYLTEEESGITVCVGREEEELVDVGKVVGEPRLLDECKTGDWLCEKEIVE